MTLAELKKQVCKANIDLARSGLVLGTFGNVSGIDRRRGLVVIKPSGVGYHGLRPRHMVVVSLKTGRAVEGGLRPSSDLPTHLELYRAFAGIGGIAHTHSLSATAWAQARRDIPALGTTHADCFDGAVPCTRRLRASEIRGDYERNTGLVIVERFARLDPMRMPAVLVADHGPFTWGRSAEEAAHNAVVLEYIASLAALTCRLRPGCPAISDALLHKHFSRKHGAGAYYGQTRP